MDKWTPSGSGADFKLSPILASLEPYKKCVTSFGNLENAATAGSMVTTRKTAAFDRGVTMLCGSMGTRSVASVIEAIPRRRSRALQNSHRRCDVFVRHEQLHPASSAF